MGSKLTLLAAQLTFVGLAAAQPAPQGPVDIDKKAVELYKQGKYDEAAKLFEDAYKLEPKAELLFGLAQAERLGGHCDKAIIHYRQLLSQTTELAAAKAVQNNLALCPGGEPPPPKDPVKSDTKPENNGDAPTKTVVREVRKTDGLGVALLAGGALGGGFAVGMFMRSSSERSDAADARTLELSNKLYDRADRDRLIAIVAGGVGAVAIGLGVFRIVRGGGESSTVAITPTTGGSMMVLTKTW